MLSYRLSSQKVRPDPQRLQPLLDVPPPRTPKELKRVSGMFSYCAKWIPKFSKTAGPLLRPTKLPFSGEALATFNELKKLLSNACLTTIQNGVPFEVETDASDFVIVAIVSQGGRPVAFKSRTRILAKNITLLSRKKTSPSSKPFDVGHISSNADTSRSSLIRERSRLCSTNVSRDGVRARSFSR